MKVYVKDSELKRRIMQTGHTMTSFAEEINTSRTYLSSIVNRKNNLSPEMAMRIAMVLNTDFNHLFFVGTAEEYELLKEDTTHV